MEYQSPYTERRAKPWGFERICTPPTLPYAGKVLHVTAGCRLSLQQHDTKLETLMLLSGRAILWIGPSAESLERLDMQLDQGYTVNVMQVHRIESLEDCEIMEVSTPEAGVTFRLQDDYARADEQR